MSTKIYESRMTGLHVTIHAGPDHQMHIQFCDAREAVSFPVSEMEKIIDAFEDYQEQKAIEEDLSHGRNG